MKHNLLKSRFVLTLWRLMLLSAGSAMTATGISLLLAPHKLLSGGVTGTSMLLSYVTPIDTGIWVIAINIPLFIIAWRKIDLHFCVYSIIGVAMLSGAILFLDQMPDLKLVSDPLLAALFGGMLCGGGGGIAIRARASHGGTDIISVVVRQKFSIGIGMFAFYVNIILVALLSIRFSIELGLLTIFSQFVTAKTLDRVVTGFNTAKSVTIISDKADEIAEYIMKRMYRGITFLEGQGGFGGRPKKVILCIVTTSQLSRIKGAMKQIDPDAFMIVSDANEIVGTGFYNSPL